MIPSVAEPTVVTGLLKLVWFSASKASARIWRVARSLIFVFLVSAKSKFENPGPMMTFRHQHFGDRFLFYVVTNPLRIIWQPKTSGSPQNQTPSRFRRYVEIGPASCAEYKLGFHSESTAECSRCIALVSTGSRRGVLCFHH